jgi:hypothetical protein
MISIWGWIADAILALLLAGTLVMAIRLDRALRVVRRDRAVFEALISNLGSATNSIKLGIQALRNEADRAAEQIERRSGDADKLATDLSFLIDAAERASARLEEVRQASSGSDRPAAPNVAHKSSTPEPSTGQPPSNGPDFAGGLRQLAGIAKRRRGRAAEAGASPENNDAGAPKMAARGGSR